MEGAEVVRWMLNVGLERTRQLIVGCGFDDGGAEQLSILDTMRAAILLDLYEAQPDASLLPRARKWAAKVWSLSKSNLTGNVYERLPLGEQRSEQFSAEGLIRGPFERR